MKALLLFSAKPIETSSIRYPHYSAILLVKKHLDLFQAFLVLGEDPIKAVKLAKDRV
ncbi:hypothetical protein PNA2_0682 [Pyrococcus sp. NA2]|uniref:hypothetical protein n=1 Tax=Pyrococcus sp. (strain NA2) TaxID=342949 RepID=UPI000209AD3A|nr:hypothetical protein [Pyrococcus sp. NA2]AEC51598.1 hypothetical protein PNA2_0682 [Pyrococcus sp. NA2]